MADDLFTSARESEVRAAFDEGRKEGPYYPHQPKALVAHDQRVRHVQEKLKAHLEKHSPAWEAKELEKISEKNPTIFQKNHNMIAGSAGPFNSRARLAQLAIKGVEARCSKRLSKLSQTAQGMRVKLGGRPHGPDPDDLTPPFTIKT